ncbi:pimeloyl-ACP methyl ester carboxylesterase [Prauserella isguenensis]|uniref:Pimeloyl-ACP methyl ester carboxylesterase n=2 Tax=Prauserella isguenensis TaxID=1470180 RepID=A0A839S326_9PSEU|nr:pimeloyl-ACP methyl ester carboxylesterase [Prauserella isguenensis]
MDWWDAELCQAIAAHGRRVVRYDHRDTGQSTTGEPGSPSYDGGVLDRDGAHLIEALGQGPMHLVGVSMGGAIAQSIALHRPDLVRSLTLIATTAVGGVDYDTLPGPTAALAESFENPPPDPDWSDRAQVVEWMVDGQRGFAGAIPIDEQRTRTIATEIFDRSIDVAAAGNHWLVVGGDDEDLDIRRITTPTLVVHGSHDPLFPLPHGEALAAAIPDARLLVVDGMGHQFPPPSTWKQFVSTLLEHTEGAQARSDSLT